jgi:hypothetical protein
MRNPIDQKFEDFSWTGRFGRDGTLPALSTAADQVGLHLNDCAGSAILAANTVVVAVESVDVGSDHLNGSLDVGRAIAAAACAVDVAGDQGSGVFRDYPVLSGM